MFKRDYLGKEEKQDFILLGNAMGIMQKVIDEWDKRKFLSITERKYLKTSLTWLIKWYNEVNLRLNEKESCNLIKTFKTLEIFILDKFKFEEMKKKYTVNHVVLDREEFYDWGEQIMHCSCRGCTKDRNKCRLYNVFYENDMPEVPREKEYQNNCPYAY